MKKIYQQKRENSLLVGFPKVIFMVVMMLLTISRLKAQPSVIGTTWDLATTYSVSGLAGYKNWNANGVITLTDTTSAPGNTCRASSVTETSGYNPATNFSMCFKVFFGCPGNDVIGSASSPPASYYTDLNGDGLAFSFWKNNATFTPSAANNACGGGLGYDGALNGSGDGLNKMITIEFDTYSSLGLNSSPAVDAYYGGGAPGSGLITDEISIHVGQQSNDLGLINTPPTGSIVNAGNLEDGKEHTVCITYSATSPYTLAVSIDGVGLLSYDLGTTYNLNTYFSGATLNYTWSGGEYGANNFQTIAPAGASIFGTFGKNPCTNVVMPVSLLTFSGEMVNEAVVLSWATANETNNAKFIIERSTNSYDWSNIGEVAGGGNITSITNYNYTDYNAFGGIVYYRLRQVDINGSYTYSGIIDVQTAVQSASVSIMPNPFDDVLTIKSNLKGNIDVSIHDILGQLIYHANQKSDNGTLLIQPDIASGAYVLTIQTDTFVKQQKIIKK